MKFPFIQDPRTHKPDEMVTLTVLTTIAAVVRFLFDGITIKLFEHTLVIGHIDAAVYIALLAPILGAHSYIGGQKLKSKPKGDENGNKD